MHIAVAGLNAWAFAFLTAALAGGLGGAPWHVTLGLLASVLGVLSQSAVFALFIGGAKTLKETVAVYGLERAFLDRVSRIYFRLFPWATGAALLLVAAAVRGGLARGSPGLGWVHGLAALAAYLLHLAAALAEHRQLRAMHLLLEEMAAAVPAEREAAEREAAHGKEGPTPAPRPAADPRARGKAILTLSALALATLLGYRYAAGAISDLATVLLALPLVAFLALGLYHLGRARPRGA